MTSLEKITNESVLNVMFQYDYAFPILMDIMNKNGCGNTPISVQSFQLDEVVNVLKTAKPDGQLFSEWLRAVDGSASVLDDMETESIVCSLDWHQMPTDMVEGIFIKRFLSFGIIDKIPQIQSVSRRTDLVDIITSFNIAQMILVRDILISSEENPNNLKGREFLLYQLQWLLSNLEKIAFEPNHNPIMKKVHFVLFYGLAEIERG